MMKPLSGNSSDSQAFGHIVRDHIAQLHSTYGKTYLAADSALYSEYNLAHFQVTPM
jgi:transposase